MMHQAMCDLPKIHVDAVTVRTKLGFFVFRVTAHSTAAIGLVIAGVLRRLFQLLRPSPPLKFSHAGVFADMLIVGS